MKAYELFDMPCKELGKEYDFMEWQMKMMTELTLTGEAISIKLRNNVGKMIGLLPVRTEQMTLEKKDLKDPTGPNPKLPPVWVYKKGTNEEKSIDRSDILYVRYDMNIAPRASMPMSAGYPEIAADIRALDLLNRKLGNRGAAARLSRPTTERIALARRTAQK